MVQVVDGSAKPAANAARVRYRPEKRKDRPKPVKFPVSIDRWRASPCQLGGDG
jgi:hypothetical protein